MFFYLSWKVSSIKPVSNVLASSSLINGPMGELIYFRAKQGKVKCS